MVCRGCCALAFRFKQAVVLPYSTCAAQLESDWQSSGPLSANPRARLLLDVGPKVLVSTDILVLPWYMCMLVCGKHTVPTDPFSLQHLCASRTVHISQEYRRSYRNPGSDKSAVTSADITGILYLDIYSYRGVDFESGRRPIHRYR